MLNEFINLYNSLVKLQCEFDSSHPYLKKCPTGKKASFKVSLDKCGKVISIEHITSKDFNINEVYRWQKNNYTASFPAFNVRSLYEIPNSIPKKLNDKILAFIKDLKEPRKKEIESISMQELEKLEEVCNELWDRVDMSLINSCFITTPKVLKDLIGSIPREYQVLEELIQRSIKSDSDEFKKNICLLLKQKLINTSEKIYAEALFTIKQEGKKERRGKKYGRDFLYLLTIDDWDNYPSGPGLKRIPTYHWKIQNWIKTQMGLNENKSSPIGKNDAFGKDLCGASDIFSTVSMGDLPKVAPFASNKDIPCLRRYGLKGTSLFPAGTETRRSIYKAINYIFDRQRKGITWKNITKYESGVNKRKTIVFAFCTELRDAPTLQFFDREEDMNNDIYLNEESTKLALKLFDSKVEQKPKSEIIFTILSAVDPANTKVMTSNRYSLNQLSDGAIRWQSGNSNIPNIRLPQVTIKVSKNNNKRITTNDSITVYPTEAIKLLNSDWSQDGKMVTKSKQFLAISALDLLFEKDSEINHLIDLGFHTLIYKSSRVVISAVLKWYHDYNKTGKKIKFIRENTEDAQYLHKLPSIYGLLLYKKGIRKENYMNENMFILGKYFAIVDNLYIQYHKDVNSGKVPISLLGNDHLALALQNPLEAFVTLSRRLTHPYISWAKRIKTDDKPGKIAKYCLKKIAELTEVLSNSQIPTDTFDTDKAQLLLGYLSYGG